MQSPFLSIVGAPDGLRQRVEDKDELMLLLYQKYKVQVVFDIVAGKWWCR